MLFIITYGNTPGLLIMTVFFNDRSDAGIKLAERLTEYKAERPIILALPRGGVPVAVKIAKKLHASLDVIVVRKLGAPGQPELGMGAITEGGVRVLDEHIISTLGVTENELEAIMKKELQELDRRVRLYRSGKPLPPLAGRTVILVDDGLATGATARAAIEAIRGENPDKIILAVPVCAVETFDIIKPFVDEVICLAPTTPFHAISLLYNHFGQTSDNEVVRTLKSLHV